MNVLIIDGGNGVGRGVAVGTGVPVGGGSGVGVGSITVMLPCELVVSAPLNAVRINSVVDDAATVILPRLDRFCSGIASDGPLIWIFVVPDNTDHVKLIELASGFPLTTWFGVTVKNSITGAFGSGVEVGVGGAGLTTTCHWRVTLAPPIPADNT